MTLFAFRGVKSHGWTFYDPIKRDGSMKVAVLGASGLLGQDLMRALNSSEYRPFPFDIKDFDIVAPGAIQDALLPIKPEVIINAAAYTEVDACETEKKLALDVNGNGAGNVAGVAASMGSLMVQISSDYVFDGEKESPYLPEDKPNPINIYGESKLLGEKQVRERNTEHLIIRSSWMFGLGWRNFVKVILYLADEQNELKIVDDQRGSPTYSVHLANAIVKLISTGLRGTYHLTNSGTCSWYEFACEILKQKGLDNAVKPVSSSQFPRPARRPANSVLDCSSTYEALGKPLPHWKEALREYLHLGN